MTTITIVRSLVGTFVALAVIGGVGMLLSPRGAAGEDDRQPAEQGEAAPRLPGQYVHIALYTFKSDAPEGTAAAFAAEADKCFRQISSIRGFRVGPPAKRATPKALMVQPQGDYHIGVVLTFDGFSGLATYGNHPRHNELKQKYGKHFEKIVVSDFEG